MHRIWVIPGILGSELKIRSNRKLLWVDVGRLLNEKVGSLALDAAGTGPAQPDGLELVSALPLSDYYLAIANGIRAAMAPADVDVLGWGYDWRLDITLTGADLGREIADSVVPGDETTIVAHSQGGLLARVAWRSLALQGKSNIIRRIITLGTPHRGTYSPAMVWSLEDEILEQLQRIHTAVSAFVNPLGGPLEVNPVPTALELEQVCATWPALYQLLPLLPVTGAPDPHRPAIFDADNWPSSRNISATHLTTAAASLRSVLNDPLSMPPATVLTTVAGTGHRTPATLQDPERIGSAAAFGFFLEGDGRVTVESAIVPDSAQVVFPSGHGEMQMQPRLLGMIGDLIRDNRGPTPRPNVSLSGAVSMAVGPPLTVFSGWSPDP